jgi:hypothetical protein
MTGQNRKLAAAKGKLDNGGNLMNGYAVSVVINEEERERLILEHCTGEADRAPDTRAPAGEHLP